MVAGFQQRRTRVRLDARFHQAVGVRHQQRAALALADFQHERGRRQRLRFNVVVELLPQDRPDASSSIRRRCSACASSIRTARAA